MTRIDEPGRFAKLPKSLILAGIFVLGVVVHPITSHAQDTPPWGGGGGGPPPASSCDGETCCPDYPVWCYDPGCPLFTDPCCHDDDPGEPTCCHIVCGPCGDCFAGVCTVPGPATNCASSGSFTSGSASASPSVVCLSNSITFSASATPVPASIRIVTTATDCVLTTNYTPDTITGTSYSWSLSGGASGSGNSLTTNLPPGRYIWTCTASAVNALCGVVSTNLVATGTVVNIGSVSAACQNVGVGGTVLLTASIQPSGETATWSVSAGVGTVIPQGDLTADFVANLDDGSVTVQACVSGTECCTSVTLNVVGACEPPTDPAVTLMQGPDDSGWACSCGFNTNLFGCLFFQSVEICPLVCYNATSNAWILETTCLNVHYSERICPGVPENCAQDGLNAGVLQIQDLTLAAFHAVSAVSIAFDCVHSTDTAALAAMMTQITDYQNDIYQSALTNWGVDAMDPAPTESMIEAYETCD